MLELEAAQERILSAIQPLPTETVLVQNASRRVLAEDVVAPIDLPSFDNSAMDGYAVHAADLKGATSESPIPLRLLGQTPAGSVFSGAVPTGHCVRLFTGSPLPAGADAVVMQEDTRTRPETPGMVLCVDAVKPWENVRFRGEDVKQGEKLLSAGAALSVGGATLLAALGLRQIKSSRRPRIGLLATGSELVEPGLPLAPGMTYESNRLSLAALIARAGGVARAYPLVPDTLEATRSALEKAMAECDAVVTSGGVSVGELDLVKAAFEELGGRLEFWKVAIRPGKPFVFGRRGEKFLFGLPGNPVSAFVTFLLLVRPALRRWQGAQEVNLPSHPAVLAEPLANSGARRHFVRVRADSLGRVRSAGTQASHILRSLAEANGLVDLPPGSTFQAGETMRVLRWGD